MVYIRRFGAVENEEEAELARNITRDVLSCNFKEGSFGRKYWSWLKTSTYQDWPLHNSRLKNVCEDVVLKKTKDPHFLFFFPGGGNTEQHTSLLIYKPQKPTEKK